MDGSELSAVEAEIVTALRRDETRMGDVWRGKEAGKTAELIATELETQTSNFVSKYLRFARAMMTGKLPTAPTITTKWDKLQEMMGVYYSQVP